MQKFMIKTLIPIQATTVDEAVNELRAIPAKWKKLEDPFEELSLIRTGSKG